MNPRSSLLLIAILFSSAAFAQEKFRELPPIPQKPELPEVLIPSEFAQAEAKKLDAEVFKLLPRGMYKDPEKGRKDEDNPIGIREGGAFYSFTLRGHSYNRTPQVMLDQGNFHVGFAGSNYGMIADIGVYPFGKDYSEIPEFVFMNSYKPPKVNEDIEKEQRSFRSRRVEGVLYRSNSVPAIAGHTYLIRAISFYPETDIFVTFKVLDYNEDGSVEIAWKTLSDFGKPIILYLSDADLKASIDKIVLDNGLQGFTFDVKDNVIIWRSFPNDERNRFWEALRKSKLQTRGEDSSRLSPPR